MQTSRRAARITWLRTRHQGIAARARDGVKQIADRMRRLQTHETEAERKRETRRKTIGVIRPPRTDIATDISLDWLDEQIQAPVPPVTARQKKLLARLVEEHPRLAREFGVGPDEPELKKLGKATSLIRAKLDRVNARAPPDER